MAKLITVCLTALLFGGSMQGMDKRQYYLGQALIYSAGGLNYQELEQHLARGANVNAANDSHETGLIMAVRGDVDGTTEEIEAISKLLIANAADVNAKDKGGRSVLIHAAISGNQKICRLLIAHGADINATDRGNYWTALLLAAQKGHKEVCKLLIDVMIKPTKEQVDSIVALLGISKKRQSKELNLIGRDVVKLIGRELYNGFKRLNKPKAEVKIDEFANEKMKQELLDYLNSI